MTSASVVSSPVSHAPLRQIVLDTQELRQVHALISDVLQRYPSVETDDLHANARLYADELPRRLRRALNDFRLQEPPGGICLVSGYRIDDSRIGRTPAHWRDWRDYETRQEEIYLVLLGAALGEPIAWSTQQDGRIVHDVLPIRGHESEQLGTGSEQLLWWHTEDAFHPFRGDYVALFCLRNPDRVATTVACVDDLQLSERHVDLLFEPHYIIEPDQSHLAKHSVRSDEEKENRHVQAAYERISRMKAAPEKVALLFGDRAQPYVRIDPYFMTPLGDSEESKEAASALIAAIEARLTGLVLETGDVAIIDNFRTVHGRKPFHARYDGNDRWLKRINVTRDLRKSRSIRRSCSSRVLW